MKKISYSIFFPCYNDSQSIPKLVKNTDIVFKKLKKPYEIIVVDDGSHDNSVEVLEKLTSKVKNLRIVKHKKNRGYGGALKSGFKNSKGELVFYTDGDGQYAVNEFPILLSCLTKDIDFVNGIKAARSDDGIRVVIGKLYSFICRWMFWLPVDDVDCDFRLIRRSILKKIKLTSNSGTICVELVKRCHRVNAKFRQVSVSHLEREFGKSQFFKLPRLIHTLFELIPLWYELMVVKRLKKNMS